MEKDVGYLQAILEKIFTGSTADPIIAVLLFLCFVLAAIAWLLGKALYKREKQHQDVHAETMQALHKANERLQEITDNYIDSVEKMNDSYNYATQETLKSYQAVAVTLTEVKTLLNTIIIYQRPR